MVENINSLRIARELMTKAVPKGGAAIDATAGRGRDTLFLAELVGPTGRVWAFDVQDEAIEATAALLKEHRIESRVNLIKASHELLGQYVHNTPVHGVMFNLGYLPGADKSLVTRPAATLKALQAAIDLLAPAGIVTLVVYTGHSGGREEAEQLEAYLQALPLNQVNVARVTFPNQSATAPYLLAVQKR